MHLDEKKSNQKKKFSSKSNFFFLGEHLIIQIGTVVVMRPGTGWFNVKEIQKKKILYNIFSFEISFPTKKTLKI